MPSAVAVVLAAGASARMGRPKALVEYDGVPALLRIERACHEAGVERVVAVLGRDARDIEVQVQAHLHERTEIVAHPEWERGRTGSLQKGLVQVQGYLRALVWPVDHPLATAATARALLATPGEWVVPEHAGRAGHPIVLGGDAIARVLAAAPDTPLRELRRDVVRVPVADEGVLMNLDTPTL